MVNNANIEATDVELINYLLDRCFVSQIFFKVFGDVSF